MGEKFGKEEEERMELMEAMIEGWAGEIRELRKEVQSLKKEIREARVEKKEVEEIKKEIEAIRKREGKVKTHREKEEQAEKGEEEEKNKEAEKEKKAREQEEEEAERIEKEKRKKNVAIKRVGGTKKWREDIKRIINMAAGKSVQIEKEWECGGADLSKTTGTAIAELWSEEEKKEVVKGKIKAEIKEGVILEEDLTFKEREKRWRYKAKLAEERYRRNCALKETAEKERQRKDSKRQEEAKREEPKETEGTVNKKKAETQRENKEKEETMKGRENKNEQSKKALLDKLAEVLNELRNEESKKAEDEKDGKE